METTTTTTCGPHRMAAKPNDTSDLNGMNMLLEAIACIDNTITKDCIVKVLPNEQFVHVIPNDIAIGVKTNSYYNYTSVHGYDLCNVCGKKVALTKEGALRKHRCHLLSLRRRQHLQL